MLKSFFNGFSGGLGRTFGRLLAYIIFGLLAFILIYYTNKESDFNLFDLLFMPVHAAENSFSPYAERHNCASGFYDIEKPNDATYGQVGTSYNITFNYISFYATYNLQPNKYYDIRITFKSNISNNIFNDDYGESLGLSQTHVFIASSMCGNTNGEVTISSYSISGKVLTLRVLVGSTLVDYWQLYTRFTFVGSQGISSTTIEAVDLSGSSGIIENANDNTNSIINNQNDNTQDIIDNQDQNTQDIIDSQQDINDSLNTNCKNGPLTITKDGFTEIEQKYLASDGTETSNNSYTISPYLIIKPSTEYKIHFSSTSSNVYWCWYNTNRGVIGCQNYSNTDVTWTSPSNATSIRFSLGGGRIIDVTGPVCNDWLYEQNQQISSKLDQFLAFPTVKLILFSNSIQEWANWINNPVANFVTLPVELVSKINTVSQTSCSSFNLGSLLGTNLSYKCFTLSDVLPNDIVNIIDTIACISLSFVIVKRIYETVSDLITLGGESEVKSYFHVPTPLEFLASFF